MALEPEVILLVDTTWSKKRATCAVRGSPYPSIVKVKGNIVTFKRYHQQNLLLKSNV